MDKRFKLVLLASLALNLLLIGVSIGYMARSCRHRPHPKRIPEAIVKKLPEQKAALLNKKMEELHKKNRKISKAIRKTRKEILQIIVAPQFDAQAYYQKSKQLHELHGQRRMQLDQTVVELAESLDQDERAVLAEFIRQKPRHHKKRRKHQGPSHDRRDYQHSSPPPNHFDHPGGRHRPPPPPPNGDEHRPPPSFD